MEEHCTPRKMTCAEKDALARERTRTAIAQVNALNHPDRIPLVGGPHDGKVRLKPHLSLLRVEGGQYLKKRREDGTLAYFWKARS